MENLKNEVWKDVVGYETYYKVSNKGRVATLRNNRHTPLAEPKIRKQYRDDKGYYYINLRKCGCEKRYAVHRLVAIAFIPNENNYPEVNHKDENPSNNCVENLEWCTKIYNVNYGTAIERNAKKKSKPVSQYSKDGKLLGVYSSQHSAKILIKADRIHKHIEGNTRYKTVKDSLWQRGNDSFPENEETVNFKIKGRWIAELSADMVDIVPE